MFYERLKSVCELAGTTVTTVAIQFLGVTSATPTGWKRGAYPRADVVIKAAKHFGISSDYLLGLTADSSVCTNSEYISDVEKEILDVVAILRTAKPATRAAAIASLKSIVNSLDSKKGSQTSYSLIDENEASDSGAV